MTLDEMELMNPEIWDGRYFSGDWREAETAPLAVTEKATDEKLGSVAVVNVEEARDIFAKAAAGALLWSKSSVAERARILRKAGELLGQYSEEAIIWLVRESGSTRFKAAYEIQCTLGHFENSASLIEVEKRLVVQDDDESLSYAERVPIGVVGVIGPFNLPLILSLRSVTAGLAGGNSVVLKPSPRTPVSGGVLIARLFEEAGLPEGVLHVINGGADIAGAMCEDSHVSMIAFTGSTEAGRNIAAKAGQALKRVNLELGGKNPFLVLEDADVEMAAKAGAFGTFLHQGQICLTAGLHIIPEKFVEEYVAHVARFARDLTVGDPYASQVSLGPLINEEQRDKVDAIVKDALQCGAELVEGGTFEKLFYRPTVLKNVPAHARAFREEIFGPVAVITSYEGEEEGIRLANGTGCGLSAAVFGELGHAEEVAVRLEAGMVHVNDQTVHGDARAPFGGIKASGNGASIGGRADLEQYTTWRWTTVTRKPIPYGIPIS